MNPDSVIDLVRQMVTLAAAIAAPLLGAGLLVGLVVAVIQAATQIQESALGFVPKVLAIGVAMVVAGPWAIDKLVNFTVNIIEGMAAINHGGLG